MNRVSALYTHSVVACATILCDQMTKYYILQLSQPSIGVLPFLTIERTYNRGISWGMLSFDSQFLFTIVSITILLFCVAYAYFVYTYKLYHTSYGYTPIIAGGISNLIDRIMHHAVVDFIHIFYGSLEGPIFNGADVCIVFGALLVLYQWYFKNNKTYAHKFHATDM